MTFEEFKSYKTDKKLFAVIGDPIGHSVSPALHTALFDCEGTDAIYISVQVKPEELCEFIGIASQKLCGFNVTIPHKNAVIAYLDNIDDTAKKAGSVNTVKVSDGRLLGFNTDIYGVQATLHDSGFSLKGAQICVLGSGGAARAVVSALSGSGAHIKIARRKDSIGKCFADGLNPPLKTVSLGNIVTSDIIINTTPVGMSGFDAHSPIDKLPAGCKFVFDVIYTPLLTPLLKMAADAGIKYSNGLKMLLMQGVRAQEIWLGRKISDSSISFAKSILLSAVIQSRLLYRGKRNILLSGFMGCGKTTVGKQLSNILSMPLIDTDAEIVKREKMTVNEIFSVHGENYFRSREKAILREFSAQESIIISSGGGAMTFRENFDAVKTSLVIYMKSDESFLYNNLTGCSDRPLMKTSDLKKRIHDLLSVRAPLYEAHCDECIDASKTVEEVTEEILSRI